MKQFFIAITALVYISTVSGVSVYRHYCMGELANWGLGQNKAKTCGTCGMEKSEEQGNGCCSDEEKFFKNTTDQKNTGPGFQMNGVVSASPFFLQTDVPLYFVPRVVKHKPVCHAPPRGSPVAVYILKRSFLI